MPPRADDPAIADAEALWRRIIPAWLTRTPAGTIRPSSAAFLDGHTGDVSVHRAALTSRDRVLGSHPDDSLVELLAGFPRSLGHAVVADATEEDPAHALICPPPDRPKKRRKTDARLMAEQARWVVLRAAAGNGVQPG